MPSLAGRAIRIAQRIRGAVFEEVNAIGNIEAVIVVAAVHIAYNIVAAAGWTGIIHAIQIRVPVAVKGEARGLCRVNAVLIVVVAASPGNRATADGQSIALGNQDIPVVGS